MEVFFTQAVINSAVGRTANGKKKWWTDWLVPSWVEIAAKADGAAAGWREESSPIKEEKKVNIRQKKENLTHRHI